MAYMINAEACLKCGTCADTCPLGIISEGEESYVIDADQCVECGSCSFSCPWEIRRR
jgi:NAD-dependent dihydropyrimidine dehydrogenase PreA subunit